MPELTDFQYAMIVALAPVAVYGLARITFAAYFQAKAAYLRRFFHDTDSSQSRRE